METLANKVNISFERNYQSNDQPVTDVIKCKILEIKQANWIPDRPIPTYEGNENDIQWVEIGGCQYAVTEGELLCWLGLYVPDI